MNHSELIARLRDLSEMLDEYEGGNFKWSEEAATAREAADALQALERNSWVDVEKALPEWAKRDDTPVMLNGEWIKPTLTSQTVLVQLDTGSVRTDYLTSIEDSGITWWNTFGKRVKFWMPTPRPVDASQNEGEAK